jgi:hypothetical protein
MTKFEFIDHYLYSFDQDFASNNRDRMIFDNTVELLIEVMNDGIKYDRLNSIDKRADYYGYLTVQGPMKRQQIVFRSAYIFEKLYFANPEILLHPKLNFLELVFIVKNESAMRHFSKIIADALERGIIKLTEQEEFQLLSVLTLWCTDPKIRVAVKVWAFESIMQMSKKNNTAQECLRGILDLFLEDPGPAIRSRMKKWQKII